jgi:uncharacterized protein (DUF2252 family)
MFKRRDTPPPDEPATAPASAHFPQPQKALPPPAYPSTADRAARGKAARIDVPREAHAVHNPQSDRPDPVALLQSQDENRVADLVPIRFGRMLASPFAFYRGAAKIMACDLARTPRTGFTAQISGDAHVANFGVFASPERDLVFDLNDFDETLPGPWEWDVKRLATSLVIAAAANGFKRGQQDRVVAAAIEEYRTTMARFAVAHNLDVWYAHLDVDDALAVLGPPIDSKLVKRTERSLESASTGGLKAAAKLTTVIDGEPRIVAEPPLVVPLSDLAHGAERDEMFAALHEQLSSYRSSLEGDRRTLLEQFRVVDFARKVVGVGSVGMRAWIALLLGLDGGDPLFLQLKEADSSVLEPYLGRSPLENHAERVVAGQRAMQATPDIFLGWLHLNPGPRGGPPLDFYVRQLRDGKGAGDLAQMGVKAMAQYGRFCAWTLARAHARTGDRIAIAAYLGKGDAFDRAIVEFAHAYAVQNERDFNALHAAVASGAVSAQTGV